MENYYFLYRNLCPNNFNIPEDYVETLDYYMSMCLSSRDKDIFVKSRLNSIGYDELAKEYGLSVGRIGQICRNSDRILSRRGLNEEESRLLTVGLKKIKESDAALIPTPDIGDMFSIRRLDLSTRARNCLWRAGIRTVKELLETSTEDLLHIRNMGIHTVEEVCNLKKYILKTREPSNYDLEQARTKMNEAYRVYCDAKKEFEELLKKSLS